MMRLTGSFIAFLFLLLATGVVQAGPLVLSRENSQPSAPVLLASDSGNAFAAWLAGNSHNGPHRISGRSVAPEEGAGEMLDLVFERQGVTLRELTGYADGEGQFHLVWVAEEGKTNRLEYLLYREGRLFQWKDDQALARSERQIENPSVWVNDQGAAWFAWQERRGSDYRIFSSHLDAAGNWTVTPLQAEQETGYRVYPEVLPGPGGLPLLVWFNLDEPEPILEKRLWDETQGNWKEESPLADVHPILLETLPLFRWSPAHGLLGLGYRTAGAYDQILFWSEQFPLAFPDYTAHSHNRYPSLSRLQGDHLGLVWQQESGDGLNLMQAILDLEEGEAHAQLLARSPYTHALLPPEPVAALTPSHLLALWVGPEPGTGQARLYFSASPIPDHGWLPLFIAPEEVAFR